jgi:hypothetical protein
MHRVIVDGPDDDRLFRLLIVVADFADRDGMNARVGQRVLAERTRTSLWCTRMLIQRALAETWLAVDKPGDSRWRTVYSLGQRLGDARKLRGTSRAGCEADAQDRANSREGQSAEQGKRELARARTTDEGSSPVARNARPGRSGGVVRAVEDKDLSPYVPPIPLNSRAWGTNPRALGTNPRAEAGRVTANKTYAHFRNWTEERAELERAERQNGDEP